jgi:hypothetical protein
MVRRLAVYAAVLLTAVMGLASCTNPFFERVEAIVNGISSGQVSAPIISPPGGRLGHNATVTISCPTPGATIVYTLDGSLPVVSGGGLIANGIEYTGPFLLPWGTTNVIAMA